MFISIISMMIMVGVDVDQGSTESPPTLAVYIAEAVESHPRLLQRHEEWMAAMERIPQAKGLEDPRFTYGQFVLSDTQRAKVTISQQFPWFGMLKAKGDQAASEADVLLSRFHAERDAIVYGVEKHYYQYGLLAEQIQIVTSQVELLIYVEEIVQTKLALGLASDDELLRVSIAKTELTDRKRHLEGLRPILSRQVGAAMGRVSHEVLPWPEAVSLPTAAPPASIIATLIQQANPNLKTFVYQLEALEYAEQVARKRGKPDITLGLDWTSISKPRQLRPDRPYPASLNAASRMISTATGATPLVPRNVLIDGYSLANSMEPMRYSGGGEDNLMLSIGVRVPLWRKKVKAGVKEAQHLQAAVEREQDALFLDLESAAQQVRYAMDDAARRYTLYADSLLPQAVQTYESLQEKYAIEYGGSSFIDILESVQQLLSFQLEQVEALYRWHEHKAELGMLMGGWPEEVEATHAEELISQVETQLSDPSQSSN